MAGGGGAALLVLLLSCWRPAEPQPVNVTSGPTTEMPPSSKGQEDIPGVFDEILVQEILESSNLSLLLTQRPLLTSTTTAKKANPGSWDSRHPTSAGAQTAGFAAVR
ncbi:sperm acrosome-associated protein 7-like [Hyaena hyaena]|uniref:sperm acrosome-associated protein 7-like n=1 Tax=Hyaena hyaena TaxID=95912 RepID=UPI001922F03D|nr:sperm acrosome-associated protein 7-like [Hyaena hyaena]